MSKNGGGNYEGGKKGDKKNGSESKTTTKESK